MQKHGMRYAYHTTMKIWSSMARKLVWADRILRSQKGSLSNFKNERILCHGRGELKLSGHGQQGLHIQWWHLRGHEKYAVVNFNGCKLRLLRNKIHSGYLALCWMRFMERLNPWTFWRRRKEHDHDHHNDQYQCSSMSNSFSCQPFIAARRSEVNEWRILSTHTEQMALYQRHCTGTPNQVHHSTRTPMGTDAYQRQS